MVYQCIAFENESGCSEQGKRRSAVRIGFEVIRSDARRSAPAPSHEQTTTIQDNARYQLANKSRFYHSNDSLS